MSLKARKLTSPAIAIVLAFVAGVAVTAAAFVVAGGGEDEVCAAGCVSSLAAAPDDTATAVPTTVATVAPTPAGAAPVVQAGVPGMAPAPSGPPVVAVAPAAVVPASVPPAPAAAPPPTPLPAVAPPPAPGGPASACTTNCGEPRLFCDGWSGGFCDDYRDKYTLQPVPFPGPGDPYSYDVLSTADPVYTVDNLDGNMSQLPGFTTDQEHFHTAMEDGGFGVAILRLQQPVDLASERHIHLDVDMKGHTRNYFRVMLSPELTKRDSDDRSGTAYPNSFLQAWFRGGNVEGTICRAGVCGDSYPFGDAFGTDRGWEPTYSADNVRVPIDLYVSQTSIRIYINGIEKSNATFAPLGFNAAYLYLSQASYNPCKDGFCAVADQIFHWDNVAFDGPVLGKNGLTPAGSRDVVFNAYSATSCSVRGVQASVAGSMQEYTWVTWVARIPDTGPPTSASEIACAYTFTKAGSEVVRGLEDVARR